MRWLLHVLHQHSLAGSHMDSGSSISASGATGSQFHTVIRSLSMPEMTPEYKSRLLTRATSKTLLIGAEEVRWLRLVLYQHSSAGSVMYGFRDLDRYSGACESQFRTVILRHARR